MLSGDKVKKLGGCCDLKCPAGICSAAPAVLAVSQPAFVPAG